MVAEHGALDATNRRGVTWFEAQRCTDRHDLLPQVVAPAAVAQIDLVTELTRPAGATDDERDAVELGLAQPVVGKLLDPVAEKGGHDLTRFRPLELQR